MAKKGVYDMTLKELKEVPHRSHYTEDIPSVFSLILLSTGRKHDSGYRCIEFVAVDKDGYPICKAGGCSDVVHIEGIMGAILNPKKASWNIDCLPKSGCFRLFVHNGDANSRIKLGPDLSSFEIFSV